MTQDRTDLTIYTPAQHINHGATSDWHLVQLWLHGRPINTARAYEREAKRFLSFLQGKPMLEVTLTDVQAFADSLCGKASSRARSLSAVKSILSFGHRLGYLPFDVGAVVKLPKVENTISERILSREQCQGMIALERNPRNHAILRLLYYTGCRVAELTGLCWRNIRFEDDRLYIAIFGKGGKSRTVSISDELGKGLHEELLAIALTDYTSDRAVFLSRAGGALTTRQVQRIVQNAAWRTGIKLSVSPHFLRHSHATHSLNSGAPIHVVQATLGHSSTATTGKYLHARPTDSSANYLGG